MPWSRQFDADAAVRDLNAAYQENGRRRPPMRWWCKVCHADYSSRVDAANCRH